MKVGVILSITKKQHYVSQGVLKHFADEHRKTYELFIDKNLVSKKSIGIQCRRTMFMSIPR